MVAFVFLCIESLLPEKVEPINYYNVIYICLCAIVAFGGCFFTYFFDFNEKLSHIHKHRHHTLKQKLEKES